MTIEEALDLLEYGDWFQSVYNNLPESTANKVAEAIEAVAKAVHSAPTSEPLTLEQLREMDGKPVFVVRLEDNSRWWAIVRIGKDRVGTDYGGYFMLSDYGVTWIAYAYPPAHIDREKWEPCECCRSARFMNGEAMHNFFHSCGRPLTEKAWEELQKHTGIEK